MGFFKMNLEGIETYISNNLKLFSAMAVGLIVFIGIVAVSVFFVTVRGAEQTMVPNVEGYDLTSALIELQVKELYPRIQLRYTQSSADRGLILEQIPPPGTIVKAGRRIQLVVSQGAVINTVENYVGRDIEDVRIELYAHLAAHNFSSGSTSSSYLITLRDPLMYEFSPEPAGTILQQRPLPGANITGPTVVDLVVSRGTEHTLTRIPNLVGLNLEDTLEQIGQTGIDFEFSLRQAQSGERAGTIVAQNPAGNTLVAASIRVAITMASPESLPVNHVFGLFTYEMARNPYPLLLRLESILPNGERQRLLSVQYPGGRLTVPYVKPPGTVLVLYMLNREIHRELIP